MTEVRRELFLAGLVLLVPPADVWAPVRFMAGEWEGTSSGQPGTGKVTAGAPG